MRKIILLMFIILSYNSLKAQKLMFGIGGGCDMKMSLVENYKYKCTDSSVFMPNMNVFFKFKTKKGFNFMPVVHFNLMETYVSYRNVGGHFMPEGYTVSIPYRKFEDNWSPTYYSREHYVEACNAFMTQINGGLILSKDIKNFELGIGAFLNYRKISITDRYAVDRYLWFSSTGTETDNYSYVDSNEYYDESGDKTYLTSAFVSVPLYIQYNYNLGNKFYMGINFTAYIGEDQFLNVGLNISTDLFGND